MCGGEGYSHLSDYRVSSTNTRNTEISGGRGYPVQLRSNEGIQKRILVWGGTAPHYIRVPSTNTRNTETRVGGTAPNQTRLTRTDNRNTGVSGGGVHPPTRLGYPAPSLGSRHTGISGGRGWGAV